MKVNIITESAPLQPITGGVIVLVGIKISNLPPDLRYHPQIVMWESQSQHWTSKDLPLNTRAVFLTRWIGHNEFSNIMKQARARHITIFNPQGTGMIVKQLRELLNMNGTKKEEGIIVDTPTTKVLTRHGGTRTPKMYKLRPFVDFNKSNAQMARELLEKAKELEVDTTFGSIAQWLYATRKKEGLPPLTDRKTPRNGGRKQARQTVQSAIGATEDVAVQMFDNIIKEMTDMRELLSKTMAENVKLRAKVTKFRKFFETEE